MPELGQSWQAGSVHDVSSAALHTMSDHSTSPDDPLAASMVVDDVVAASQYVGEDIFDGLDLDEGTLLQFLSRI